MRLDLYDTKTGLVSPQFGYVAEVTYEGEAVYPEDFEGQTGEGGGIYSASPSVHSNTVYKANRRKSKKPYNPTPPSSIHKPSPSQYKPAPKRPVKAPSAYSNEPEKGSPYKPDRVEPKPVKIPYNQDAPKFNPSYRPNPSNPYLAQSNPVPQKPANQPYDRVRFEEIVKLQPSPAAQPYKPEPRQPAILAPEFR